MNAPGSPPPAVMPLGTCPSTRNGSQRESPGWRGGSSRRTHRPWWSSEVKEFAWGTQARLSQVKSWVKGISVIGCSVGFKTWYRPCERNRRPDGFSHGVAAPADPTGQRELQHRAFRPVADKGTFLLEGGQGGHRDCEAPATARQALQVPLEAQGTAFCHCHGLEDPVTEV